MIPIMGLIFTNRSTLEARRTVGHFVLHNRTPGSEPSICLGGELRITGIHQWSLNLLHLGLLYFSLLQMSLLMDSQSGLGVKPA